MILTDDERVRLDSLAHQSRTAPHLERRARVVAHRRMVDEFNRRRRLQGAATGLLVQSRAQRRDLSGLYGLEAPGDSRAF